MLDLQLKFLQDLKAETLQEYDPLAGLRILTKAEKARYAQLEPDLQLLFDESRIQMLAEQSPVIEPMDIYLVCGHRGKEEQTRAVAGGFSKVFWPKGKHNKLPSHAMDCAPFPIDWDSPKAIKRFKYMVDLMMRVAKRLEAKGRIKKIRFGADFNMDGNLTNDKWVDLPHIEAVV